MTRPRILFVDDEPQALRGLQRVLRGSRVDWDLEFAQAASEALQVLDLRPVDVIVTDMRMPGTDGATLLEQVRAKHPTVIRMVLSGQSGREEALRAAAAAHQYMSKPCDAAQLRARIEAALASRELLSCGDLQGLVGRLNCLPSLPALYFQVLRELGAPNPSIDRIAQIVECDVAMTAKLLQLVNSAFFSLQAHVTSPQRALQLLGLDAVRSLVLTAHVFDAFKPACEGFDGAEFWRHSADTGRLALQVFDDIGGPPDSRSDSFTAGLLHDVGKLVLATALPEEYAAVLAEARQLSLPDRVVEARLLGATHAELGGFLLSLWGVPQPVVAAVWRHHEPRLASDPRHPVLMATHVANAIDRRGTPLGAAFLDVEALSAIGLDVMVSRWFEGQDEEAASVQAARPA
jgi:HD-like signal output (HDOD) protein/CheY-like chemotaxis protein